MAGIGAFNKVKAKTSRGIVETSKCYWGVWVHLSGRSTGSLQGEASTRESTECGEESVAGEAAGCGPAAAVSVISRVLQQPH